MLFDRRIVGPFCSAGGCSVPSRMAPKFSSRMKSPWRSQAACFSIRRWLKLLKALAKFSGGAGFSPWRVLHLFQGSAADPGRANPYRMPRPQCTVSLGKAAVCFLACSLILIAAVDYPFQPGIQAEDENANAGRSRTSTMIRKASRGQIPQSDNCARKWPSGA